MAKGRREMRLARILLGVWIVLGGITACSDHNPTVVFTVDAGTTAKSEAGTSQDGGGSHDGGTAAEAAVVSDVGGVFDVSLPADLVLEANPIDAFTSADAGLDLAPDQNQSADGPAVIDVSRSAIDVSPASSDLSPAAIDGVGPGLDGSGGTSLEVGIDSTVVHDGGGTAG
jgi:hypothetical protein